ncbi:uncharacterized protein LOC143850294 [Tasmannia lanceolata]|uniref:uncharacterized protein LOC143850294 n=1 Tax=Tasmannia lanceolata TaxID=3420 RepID=UPI004062D93F
MPAVPQYDGTTDPVDHLETFRTMMLLHGASDGFICRAFPTTLTGAARDWYSRIKPNSISNFDDFREDLVRHFMSSRRPRKTTASLMALRQDDNEPLKVFVHRFNREALQRREDKPPRREKSPPPQRREGNFTPLNTSRKHILTAISEEEFVKWPAIMISKGNMRDPSKYCRFHKDHGHDTDECWQLKEEIEQLIGRGYLKKYIRTDGRKQERREKSPRGRSPRRSQPPPARNKTPQPPSTQQEAPRSQPRGVIGTIMGGPAAGATSSAARKAYARRINAVHTTNKKTRIENEISFSDADLDNLILPHDDALVITMPVANWEVKKILVDNGSSADILYYHAFQKMIGDDRLKPASSDLFGFSGEVVKVEGQIELPVLVGEPPCQAFTMVNFLGKNAVELRWNHYQSNYAMALKGKNGVESLPIELLDVRDELRGTQPTEDLISIPLCPEDKEKVALIGSSLSSSIQHQLTEFLQENADMSLHGFLLICPALTQRSACTDLVLIQPVDRSSRREGISLLKDDRQ